MKTRTVGELLQEERESRHLTIEQLAQHTKIKPESLTALEANEFSQLPSAVFVKAYIMNIARVLGFEGEPVIALLRRDFKESARGQLMPRELIALHSRRRIFWGGLPWYTLAAAIMLLIVGSYIGLQWRISQRPPSLNVTQPAEMATVGPQVVVSGTTDADSLVLINNQPAALQTDGSFTGQAKFDTAGPSIIRIESHDPQGKKTQVERRVRVEM